MGVNQSHCSTVLISKMIKYLKVDTFTWHFLFRSHSFCLVYHIKWQFHIPQNHFWIIKYAIYCHKFGWKERAQYRFLVPGLVVLCVLTVSYRAHLLRGCILLMECICVFTHTHTHTLEYIRTHNNVKWIKIETIISCILYIHIIYE